MLKVARSTVLSSTTVTPFTIIPRAKSWVLPLAKLTLTVSTSYKEEETGALVGYQAPDHHFLEAWNDAEPKKNHFSLGQPTITPIFKSRAAQTSFLTWAGETNTDYFEFVKENWKNWFYKGQTIDFQQFWDKCLYDGVHEAAAETAAAAVVFAGDVALPLPRSHRTTSLVKAKALLGGVL